MKLIEELRRYGDLQSSLNFKYVTIHPLSDQDDLLEKLHLASSQCVICDLYWVYDNKLLFVSVWCTEEENAIGVRYYQDPNVRPSKHNRQFAVATHQCPLTTNGIEVALQYLSQWINSNADIFNAKQTRPYILTKVDILASS